jgi:D-sedoheptulose 7-phosphate isomerase
MIARHLELLRIGLANLRRREIEEIARRLTIVRAGGSRAYVLGNGGSAAVAAHLALGLSYDLARLKSQPIAALALDDAAFMSAVANDLHAERVFLEQLSVRAQPGDLVIAFSASGKSPNVTAAIEWARAHAVETVAIVGASGAVSEAADMPLILDCDDPGVAEDMFHVIAHLVVLAVAATGSN